LINDVITRWNSCYLMLERLIQERAPITAVLGADNELPTTEQWSHAQWVVDFLEPFAIISKKLEPSHNVTITQVRRRVRYL
jgi:hypothetical protein